MKTLLFFLLSVAFSAGYAQGDDVPDYRSKKDLFTRIIEKDVRSDVASYSMAGIDESVGKLPLKRLPVTNYTSKSITFQEDRIKVQIIAGTFDPSKHKLGYYETKHLVKIDNKPYFGDYGKVPKTTIDQIIITVGRDTVVIPAVAYADLYNPIFTYDDGGVVKSHNNVYLSADGKKMYVYMLKQEAGGSYEVTWVIKDNKYLRRVVDFGFLK